MSTYGAVVAQTDRERDGFPGNEIAWSPDGQRLALATPENLWLYDMDSGHAAGIGDCEQPSFNPVFNGDGTVLAYSRDDGEVVLSNLTVDQPEQILQTTAQRVNAVVFDATGELLAVAVSNLSRDGYMPLAEIQVWNIRTGDQVSRFDPLMNQPGSLAFVPDTSALWVSGTNVMYDAFMNFVQLYDFASGALIVRLTDKLADYALPVIQGEWIATANTDEIDPFAGTHWLELWNTRIGQPPRVVPLENVVFYGLDLASSGNAVATAINGGIIQVWRGTTSVFRITEDRRINGLALSPEGDALAVSIAGESMPIVDLWDVASGTRLASLDTADWLSQCAGA